MCLWADIIKKNKKFHNILLTSGIYKKLKNIIIIRTQVYVTITDN